MTARKVLDRAMTEAELQSAVVELAHVRGWLVMHTRAAYSRGKWSTPIQGDPGFPDLVLARRGRVVFAELKSEKGTTSKDQEAWFIALSAGDEDVWEWRPSDWSSGLIARVLA